MNYLIFKGKSTMSLPNVLVAKMPEHRKARMRYTEFFVDGRDGALHREEGLANFDLECTLMMFGTLANTRQIINDWASGTGKLITSDDPEKCYLASVLGEVKYGRAKYGEAFYDSAKITFNCDPYMYEAEEQVTEFTQSGTITNIGTATAFPLIQIEGSGTCDFSIAGEHIILRNVLANTPVNIDCEAGYIWMETGAGTMEGNFPELAVGENDVILTSGVTKMTITPRWRWI